MKKEQKSALLIYSMPVVCIAAVLLIMAFYVEINHEG